MRKRRDSTIRRFAMSNMQRRDFVRRVGVAGLLGLGAAPFAFAAVKPDAKSALLVVDVQNCFVTGGTLPVKEGEAVVPIINKLSNAFENVIVTQDWHTAGHVSVSYTHLRAHETPEHLVCRL